MWEQIVDELGTPLYDRCGQLEVYKCVEPTHFKQNDRFILNPEGFQIPNEYRTQDRNTRVGKKTDGEDACDIILHEDD